LGTEILEVEGSHATVDAWTVRKGNTVSIVVTNLAMPRHPIQTELVDVRLAGWPAPRTAWIERIDEDHANPRRLWRAMGEPDCLSPLQLKQLSAASCLRKEAQPWKYENGNTQFAVDLPPQSVAAVTIEYDGPMTEL
jgi:xylan 1,4-beta-xylosidase